MSKNGSIPADVVKLAMLSMVAAALVFGSLPVFGINILLGRSAGLVLGTGVLLTALAFDIGRARPWIVCSLSFVGCLLFLLGGAAIIR